jgi:hypothetical protein
VLDHEALCGSLAADRKVVPSGAEVVAEVRAAVAVRDIVRWLVELFPEELNLPPDPSLESRSVDGG